MIFHRTAGLSAMLTSKRGVVIAMALIMLCAIVGFLYTRISLRQICGGEIRDGECVAFLKAESQLWVENSEIKLNLNESSRLVGLMSAGCVTYDGGACLAYAHDGRQWSSMYYVVTFVPRWMDSIGLSYVGRIFAYNVHMEYHPATCTAVMYDLSVSPLKDVDMEHVLIVSNIPPASIHFDLEFFKKKAQMLGYEDWRYRGQ